jgi:hypothetical protein
MTAMIATLTGAVHTGSCVAVPRALTKAAARFAGLLRADSTPPEREYCLHDEEGHPLGVIRSPAGRPEVGHEAPSIYLRRAG